MGLAAFQSFADASTGLGADPVVNKPSGTVQGDLLVAVGVSGGGGTLTAPAGWTQHLGATLWTKVAGASEPSTYTWVLSGITTTGYVAIVRVSGQDATDPIDAVSGVSAPNTVTNIVIPTLNSAGTNRLLLQLCCRAAASASFTPPGSATERYDQAAATALLSGAGGDEIVGSGATGSRTWVPSSSSGQAFGYMLAIAPASVDVNLAPPASQAHALAYVPSLSAAANLTPPAARADGAMAAAVVSAGVNVEPPRMGADGAALLPVLSAGVDLSPPPAAAEARAVEPVLLTSVMLEAAIAEAMAAALPPEVSAGAVLLAPPMTAEAAALEPALEAHADMRPRPAQAEARAVAPQVSAGAHLQAPAATADATMLAPGVNISVGVPVAGAEATMRVPDLTTDANVLAPSARAEAAAMAPDYAGPWIDPPKFTEAYTRANRNQSAAVHNTGHARAESNRARSEAP